MSELPTSAFCLTCLSTTRNLYPIEDAKFFACLTLLKLADPSQFSLCWECNTYVKKAKLFRQKALKAHVLLNTTDVIPSNMEMTSLVHKNLNHILAITTHTPILHKRAILHPVQEKEEEVCIDRVLKQEPEDADSKSDQEWDDDVGQDMSGGKSSISTKNVKVAVNTKPIAQKTNHQVIKLIRLPPGPIPKNLKPVPAPPKIIKCITRPPKKYVQKKYTPLRSIPIEHERPSAGLEYIEVQSKCTIRALTEERRLEVRERRLKEASEDTGRYFCERCAEFFKTKLSLIDHMKKHDTYCTGDYECNVCGMRFEKKDLLRIHNNTHYRIIICNACSEEFSTYDKFLYHYKWRHDDTPVDCKTCGLTFTNRNLWKNHTRRHGLKRKECPVCRKLVRNDILKAHIAAHQPQPLLECDACGVQCRGEKRLYIHKRNVHTQLKEGEAYCAECNIQFKNMYLYQSHLKQSARHVNEGVQCQQCGREFSCLAYLKGHVDRVHSELGYNCEQCQQSFTSSVALSRHVLRVHKKWAPPKNKICDICGKGFAENSTLRQHRNGHLNIRPYKCPECSDAFSYSGALYTHIKLKHRKEKRGSKRREERE